MTTPLSITSLDQGKLYRGPAPRFVDAPFAPTPQTGFARRVLNWLIHREGAVQSKSTQSGKWSDA